jgi:superoxide reductase
MTQKKQIYKCAVCGNITEVLHNGGGELVCCGQPMDILEENTADASFEKHVPMIEKTKDGVLVKVGSVFHPMTPEHFIEWIEIIADGREYKKFLTSEDKPEAEFIIVAEMISARIYCNLHGLWKSV